VITEHEASTGPERYGWPAAYEGEQGGENGAGVPRAWYVYIYFVNILNKI